MAAPSMILPWRWIERVGALHQLGQTSAQPRGVQLTTADGRAIHNRGPRGRSSPSFDRPRLRQAQGAHVRDDAHRVHIGSMSTLCGVVVLKAVVVRVPRLAHELLLPAG